MLAPSHFAITHYRSTLTPKPGILDQTQYLISNNQQHSNKERNKRENPSKTEILPGTCSSIYCVPGYLI